MREKGRKLSTERKELQKNHTVNRVKLFVLVFVLGVNISGDGCLNAVPEEYSFVVDDNFLRFVSFGIWGEGRNTICLLIYTFLLDETDTLY